MINEIGENTKNIKYIGNTWQKTGSIEYSECMYTPENLLNLLYRESSFNEGEFRYKIPIGDEVMPAMLNHDLILVNIHYYTGTEVKASNNIYSLKDYLDYGISIGNPIYDNNFKVRFIPLLDESIISTSQKTLNDFIQIICRDVTNYEVYNILNYFKLRYSLERIPDSGDTISEFYGNLSDESKEKFLRDFSLPVHDPDSIKLPFYQQKLKDGSATPSNRIATRFTLNAAAASKPSSVGINSFNYIESLSNLAEYVLTGVEESNSITYDIPDYRISEDEGFAIESNTLENTNVANNLTPAEKAYIQKGLTTSEKTNNFPPENKIDLIAARNSLRQLTRVGTGEGFNTILNPVYIGYNSSIDMKNSNAIQLCIPQDKATVLINEDDYETWDIFGGLVLGFKLVDALIAQRTFIGSVWAWGTLNNIQNVNDNAQTDVNVSNIDLYKSIKNYPDQKAMDSSGWSTEYTYSSKDENYRTIQILNELYANFGTDDTTNTLKEAITEPVKKWLENESVIFKAPFFGDFVEEKNFQQDLTPESKVAFKEVFVDKERGGKGRYKDSITRVPYIEQTMPLIYKPEGIDIAKAKASTTFNSKSIFEDSINGFNITPPFIADSEKGDESESLTGKPLTKSGAGSIRVEERIISKTIDEIWTYIKKLSEDANDEALPEFYGIKAKDTHYEQGRDPIRLNPRITAEDEKLIDILSWEPTLLETGEGNAYPDIPYSNKNYKELQFKGWKVTDHIVKYLDYKIEPFSRDSVVNNDYHFEKDSKGYLTQLYNNIETALGFIENSIEVSNEKVMDRFENTFNDQSDEDLRNVHSEIRRNREKAREVVSNILNFVEYKEYLENPKNLKTIERDLETLKLNVKMLADYLVSSFVMKGFADRGTNRGTLHTLHRNHFEFTDTLIPLGETQDVFLNDLDGSLEEEVIDKKVLFEDGKYDERYIHPENIYSEKEGLFGVQEITWDEDNKKYVRVKKTINLEEANKAKLHQIYLAADGTWRYIFDGISVPIVDDEF